MSTLSKKIDFAIIFSVNNANPNGDPLDGNRPRITNDGHGEVSDVCLKRKIRDRLQEEGETIFVQSDEKKTDGMKSLQERAKHETYGLGKEYFKKGSKKTNEETISKSCEKWFDVRSFGQVFAFEKEVSISIRGPVTIQSAFSLEKVDISSIQITKSVSGKTSEIGKKGSDTMGMKHRVDRATYISYGAISPQLAERAEFSDEDADKIKKVLPKLFEGDASSARPEGSMIVEKVIWWKHDSKSGQYSSAKVHNSLREKVEEDGSFDESELKKSLQNLEPEIIDGYY